MKNLFSFFIFYYYLMRGNPKSEDIATSRNTIPLYLTPLFLFISQMILLMIFFNIFMYILLVLFGISIIVNLIVIRSVSEKKHKKLEEEREMREFERRVQLEKEERLANERFEEALLKWKRVMEKEKLEREIRELEEELRRTTQRIRDKMNRQRREQYDRDYDHFNRMRNDEGKPKDNNLTNALKLMGLKANPTEKDIKTAYRKLSKIHHPDLGGLEANFIRLTKAYDYLMKK